MLACKYVDENGSAVMLATKRSAGVTPEVNLTIPLCIGDEACKQGGSALALKSGVDITGCLKHGYQWPHKRTGVLQIVSLNIRSM